MKLSPSFQILISLERLMWERKLFHLNKRHESIFLCGWKMHWRTTNIKKEEENVKQAYATQKNERIYLQVIHYVYYKYFIISDNSHSLSSGAYNICFLIYSAAL